VAAKLVIMAGSSVFGLVLEKSFWDWSKVFPIGADLNEDQ
jgi:hypothetical protein